MHDRLEIKVWTESFPFIRERVVIDYTEPIIDPRLWEILEKSQIAAWKRAIKMSGTIDEKVRSFAKEIKGRVYDPANYGIMEERLGGYVHMAMRLQDDVRDAAESKKISTLALSGTKTQDESRTYSIFRGHTFPRPSFGRICFLRRNPIHTKRRCH